ncbi:MAG TPA: hypothetical protein VHY48_03040 [Acidobacteriaceae bacterium]|nr:hypothetical protein [Acidobacteriaceae bacterium]
MAKKYGHFEQDELRAAVEKISGDSGSPVNSPVLAVWSSRTIM